MKIEITFHSGTKIEADVEEFTIASAGVTGGLRELRWTHADGATRRLKHVDLTQVAAVVAIREPGDADKEEDRA